MRRVAEIMYIVESDREAFIQSALHPDEETKRVLWLCGVRKQLYFEMNDLIFMTFEYEGENFEEDMRKMGAYLDQKGFLVKKRRKDVPVSERSTTNWWAPVKRLGALLDEKPDMGDEQATQKDYIAMLDGCMNEQYEENDISYAEEDWMEEVYSWKQVSK